MMTDGWLLVLAVLFSGVGMWLMLPRIGRIGRGWGIVLGLVGFGLFGARLQYVMDGTVRGVFMMLAVVTVVACAATVTARNPVYSAIWFGLALLGTAGLFLLQGAQFLGVATLAVYAGAILVTFLFVLMLAQPEGQADYDRISWEAPLSAATGAVLVGMLTMAVTDGLSSDAWRLRVDESSPLAAENPLAENHVARLGAQLFGKHLVAVEVAGVLLLAALVGAVAIVAHSRQTPLEEKEPG